MSNFGAMAVSGVVGVLILKVMMAMMMPLIATAFGIMAMVFKWGLIIGLGFLVWNFFKKRANQPEQEVA